MKRLLLLIFTLTTTMWKLFAQAPYPAFPCHIVEARGQFFYNGLKYEFDGANVKVIGRYWNSRDGEGTDSTNYYEYYDYMSDVEIPSEAVYNGKEFPVVSISCLDFWNVIPVHSICVPKSVRGIANNLYSRYSYGSDEWTARNKYKVWWNIRTIEKIVVDEDNPYWDSRENCNCLIQTEGDMVFYGCKNSFLPTSVKAIAKEAFARTEIEEIEIPQLVWKIQESTFEDCKKLRRVVVTASTKELPRFFCSGCVSLKDVELTYRIETIGDYAFNNCGSIENIKLPTNLTKIGSHAFNGCSNLESVEYPEHLSYIYSNAFSGCNFEIDDLPKSLLFIGVNAFDGCRISQTTFEFPENVNHICKNAVPLSTNPNVETLILPHSLEKIDLLEGTKLKKIIVNANTPPVPYDKGWNSHGTDYTYKIFSDEVLQNATLYVPQGTKELYEDAPGWYMFAHIEEFEPTALTSLEMPKDHSGAIYDIQGRWLSKKPVRGFYIQDGKKHIAR